MSVSMTSKDAYTAIKDKLGARQTAVYEAITELGVATNEAIAEHLNWPLQSVTGRVTELRNYGLIDVEGLGKNKSGFTAKLWSVRNLNDKKLFDMARDCES